jgi:hypothetical protein
LIFQPDATSLSVLASVDNHAVEKQPSYASTSQTTCCHTGIELRQADKGGAHDNEIQRGLEQLRYAMPLVLTNAIMKNIMGHEDDNRPLVLCPILVTVAELYVMHKPFSDKKSSVLQPT